MLRKRLGLAVSILLATGSAAWSAACGSSTFDSNAGGDASTDTGVVADSAPGSDATADSAVDAGPRGFCESQSPTPSFCADFDESDPRIAFNDGTSGIAFTDFVSVDGGSIGVVDGGEDGSSTLVAALPDLAGGQAMKQSVTASLPKQDGESYHFGADLRFDHVGSVSGSTHVYLATFELDESASVHTTFDLVIYSSNLHLDIGDENGTADSIVLGSVPPASATWYHLDVEVVQGGSVKASFNGMTDKKSANVTPSRDLPVITLGTRSAGNSGQIQVSYDDVTLTLGSADAGDGG